MKDPHTAMEMYENLPFLPQKKEQTDRRDILLRSKEFNPLVSFPIMETKQVSSHSVQGSTNSPQSHTRRMTNGRQSLQKNNSTLPSSTVPLANGAKEKTV